MRVEGLSRRFFVAQLGRDFFSKRPGVWPTGPGSRFRRAGTVRHEAGDAPAWGCPPNSGSVSLWVEVGRPRPLTQTRRSLPQVRVSGDDEEPVGKYRPR